MNEPLKMRSYSYLGFVVRGARGYITFSYKKAFYDDETARFVLEKALEELKKII